MVGMQIGGIEYFNRFIVTEQIVRGFGFTVKEYRVRYLINRVS
jgi:hypothetical protein